MQLGLLSRFDRWCLCCRSDLVGLYRFADRNGQIAIDRGECRRDALRRGIRADGANLYPAMPYTSYSIFTDADVHALYSYFMRGVAPVDKPAPATDLPFPFSVRMSMKVWNLLFLNTKPFKNDSRQSEPWNRGAYLVDGRIAARATPRAAS